MTTAPMPTDDNSLRAAEYVLRLMPEVEAQQFERQLASDRGLMAQVGAWSARFAGLDEEFAPAKPHKRVKAALEARLFGSASPQRAPLWQRLGLWQGLSFASLAVAGLFAWQTLQPATPVAPAPAPLYLSEIAAEDQSLRVLAVYDSATRQLQVTRTAGAPAQNRVFELWAIAGQNAPVSLGVLAADGRNTITLPDGLSDGVAGLVLAVSDEPPGGSPTGAPTGAVLAVGQVLAL